MGNADRPQRGDSNRPRAAYQRLPPKQKLLTDFLGDAIEVLR
jgi:hypothetical protein